MRKLTVGLLCMVGWTSLAQKTPLLIDGASIQVSGTVELKRQGNDVYLVVQPASPYEAVFDDKDHRIVRVLGLSLAGQDGSLRALAGQGVEVVGKVQLEPNSPYYFNGTLILAHSVRTANGSVLTPKESTSVILPLSLTRFYSLVTFSPRASRRFTYKTWDSQGHPLAGSESCLSCILNGPGDVMNCFCPTGFVYSGKVEMTGDRFRRTEAPEDGFSFAQYAIDDPIRDSVSKAVECTRPAQHRLRSTLRSQESVPQPQATRPAPRKDSTERVNRRTAVPPPPL